MSHSVRRILKTWEGLFAALLCTAAIVSLGIAIRSYVMADRAVPQQDMSEQKPEIQTPVPSSEAAPLTPTIESQETRSQVPLTSPAPDPIAQNVPAASTCDEVEKNRLLTEKQQKIQEIDTIYQRMNNYASLFSRHRAHEENNRYQKLMQEEHSKNTIKYENYYNEKLRLIGCTS